MKVTLLILTLNEIDGVKVIMPQLDPSWYDQILIIDSDDLKNSTQETVNQVFNFLNVFPYKINNLSKINVGKYVPLDKKSKEFLSEFYKPYNEKLNNLFDTKFNWNLKN